MKNRKSSSCEPVVAIARGSYRDADRLIKQVFEAAGYAPVKKKFFLKPNLVDAFSPKSAIVTHPAIVEAIIKYLQRTYPGSEIVVGDSCGVHVSFEKVVRKAGYRRLASKYGIKIISMDGVERDEYTWGKRKLRIPSLLKTHEYINIPKMKTHLQTSVSLGIKNQKGLLEMTDKKNFHRTFELHDCIRDLAGIIQPDFTVIDGILSMEGDGPLDTGTPRKNTNLIIASRDMVAADNVGAMLMGYDVDEIAHMPRAKGYTIAGPSIEECREPHVRPSEKYVKILNTHIYIDKTMCTQCAVPFKDAFQDPVFLVKVIALGGLFGIKNIIFGKYPGAIDDLDNTIGFGDCTLKVAKKHGFPTVQGCPPDPETIKKHYIMFLKNGKKRKNGAA